MESDLFFPITQVCCGLTRGDTVSASVSGNILDGKVKSHKMRR